MNVQVVIQIERRNEIRIRVRNEPGMLARALETLGKANVNVLAFCGWGFGPDEGVILLIPDDEQGALRALTSAGMRPQLNPVVTVTGDAGPNSGGALGRRLATAGLNIDYAYASTTGQGSSMAVFRVPDVDLAIQALK
jgi:hypothetical protein